MCLCVKIHVVDPLNPGSVSVGDNTVFWQPSKNSLAISLICSIGIGSVLCRGWCIVQVPETPVPEIYLKRSRVDSVVHVQEPVLVSCL